MPRPAPRGKEKETAPEAKKKRGAPPGPRTYDPERHCGAQRPNQPKGVLCKRGKGQGTSHPGAGKCDRHLGDSPSHNAAADREAERKERAATREAARQACEMFGLDVPVSVEPAEVLLDELGRVQRLVRHYETEIAMALLADQEADTQGLVDALRWERKHLTDVSMKCLTGDLATRQVEINEEKARELTAFAFAFARLLGRDPESPEVREAGREAMLQLLPGGQGAG